jgi:hypothetical protein
MSFSSGSSTSLRGVLLVGSPAWAVFLPSGMKLGRKVAGGLALTWTTLLTN